MGGGGGGGWGGSSGGAFERPNSRIAACVIASGRQQRPGGLWLLPSARPAPWRACSWSLTISSSSNRMPDTLATVMAATDASQLSAGEGAGCAASLPACRPFPDAIQRDRKAAIKKQGALGGRWRHLPTQMRGAAPLAAAFVRRALPPNPALHWRRRHVSGVSRDKVTRPDPHSPAGVPLVRLAACWPALLTCDCRAPQRICAQRGIAKCCVA